MPRHAAKYRVLPARQGDAVYPDERETLWKLLPPPLAGALAVLPPDADRVAAADAHTCMRLRAKPGLGLEVRVEPV